MRYALIKQTLALLSIFLIFSYNSNPFILGIRMSIIKRSYIVSGCLLYIEITSAGSLNVSTEANLFSSKTCFKEKVISGSSSITKIFSIFLLAVMILAVLCLRFWDQFEL